MEIERKWLVKRENIPFDLSKLPHKTIEQAYISYAPTIRIRKINDGKSYVLTVKSAAAGLKREEFELPLSGEEYERLYNKHEGRVIKKTRFFKEEAGLTLEIDIFEGELCGLCYLEIEFPDEEAAVSYESPLWTCADVSSVKGYSNASLSKYGLPQDI